MGGRVTSNFFMRQTLTRGGGISIRSGSCGPATAGCCCVSMMSLEETGEPTRKSHVFFDLNMDRSPCLWKIQDRE